MQVQQLNIPVTESLQLLIYANSAPLFEEQDASDYGESKWQLQEGKEYDFELLENDMDANNWTVVGSDAIFQRNQKHPNRGKIKTGIYVGTVNFSVRNTITGLELPVRIEIQSVKTSYRGDYRKMLTDITSYYTDLVMQQGSPVTQKFDVDYDTPQQTLYQKFAFVKSIIDSETFEESLHKVISNPVRKWTETVAERRIESVKRLTRDNMRQIATRTDRMKISNGPMGLSSIPRTLTVTHKTDTVDTHENQFIKYVLTSFYAFCSNLGTKKNATEQLKTEVEVVCENLANHINNAFFRQVSQPTHLNLGSPVLQRKEGYRELLQSWLMFDLAAKITWEGGDTVYEAGKKNVAVLYEYWLFFKLMEVVSDVFKINPADKEKLIKADDDKINLDIRQGRMNVINGKYDSENRLLNIRLFYNRTFGFEESIDKTGSWTMSMRPDYTLSIWPGEKTEYEAEADDSIVHIHFDAKYRLNKILIDDMGKDTESVDSELDSEKLDREVDIYRRGDLLKMHAYKDAIRRTGGAYVLYPGTEKKMKRGFHEIIPGLGAFCIAPGHEEDQLSALRSFLLEVVGHFMDRTSQREKIAVSSHEIYETPSPGFFDAFPEPRDIESFPDATPVLVGCFKNEQHLKWIKETRKYNIRLGGPREGAVELNTPMVKAKYLLLYNLETRDCAGFYKIIGPCPQISTASALEAEGYPEPTPDQLYMIFSISEDAVEEELKCKDWSESKFAPDDGAPMLMNYINIFEPKFDY